MSDACTRQGVYVADLGVDYKTPPAQDVRVQVAPEDPRANIVGSLNTESGLHTPQLDLDLPHAYVPSSTEGHGHLTLTGLSLSWKEYKRLLKALHRAGVIQDGYYGYAVARGQTFLRLPHVKKERPDGQETAKV